MPDDTLDAEGLSRGAEDSPSEAGFLREAAAIAGPGTRDVFATRLTPGEVLSGRFAIERLAGSGGMGAVYRATDRMTGTPVALKVMTTRGQHEERFAQEARVLADLNHPAIVRYVAHGETAEGQPYLAMEWLEGEDLAQRLGRAPLSVGQSLDVARRLAAALGSAHARGVVHRDVKPSNVLLVAGQPARATLLDFGIARTELSTMGPSAAPMTRTGIVLGTVGYMSPEQAVGDKAIDARTDVFALGCVLFECLTGVPAFSGNCVVAVLAKVLRAEAPRLRALRPELPDALDELVARMLAKDCAARVPDGGAILRELAALGTVGRDAPPAATPLSPGLSESEQRMVSVMLARLEPSPVISAATSAAERVSFDVSFVHDRARRYGGKAVRLVDGTVLVTFSGSGATAMEQAGRAASCADELRSMHPAAVVTLATGFAQTTERLPVGEVIDRAAALFSTHKESRTTVDAVTASLVETRFEVSRDSSARILGPPRRDDEDARTLLGKPTPCLGRDRELAILQSLLDQCVEERSPRAVLITAPPGTGKSRLRQEFVLRLRSTGGARIVIVRADSMSAGSALALARQIVQRIAGLSPSDPWAVQHATLRARLAERIDANEAEIIAEFLCELLGVAVEAEPSPALRSARGDPRLLADWLRSSFEDWLKVEAREPLLVVLEDLHWGDAPTLRYLDSVLKEGKLPLMVLALARPEVHETFPKLWSGALYEVPLGGLGKKAAEQLVRAVLTEPDTITVARVVERADGNAFYLEELIRAVAEGRADTLPETVVAMAHARLERLDTKVRRVLRAASVLGERFWVSGLTAILGSEEDTTSSLLALEDREVIARSRGVRFPAEREYVFRHALVRDAAYATLTKNDRTAAHRFAAEWLERAGERDPLVLADHREKGGEPERAVPWIIRAAEAAYDGGSATAAMILAERGMAYAQGAERGVLRAIQGASAGVRMDLGKAMPALREAMTVLPKGGRHWFVSATGLAFYGAMAGDPSAIVELAQAIADLPSIASGGGLYAWSAARVIFALVYTGQPDQAELFLDQLEAARRTEEEEASFVGWLAIARVYSNCYGKQENLAALVRNARLALITFEETKDSLAGANALFWEAVARMLLGQYGELAEVAERGRALVEHGGNSFMTQFFEMVRWLGIAYSGRAAESLAPLTRLADDPYPNVAVQSALGLARALVLTNDAAAAEAVARRALVKAHGMIPVEAGAHAVLARALLARGRLSDSLASADRALAFPVSNLLFCDELPLTRAEALEAVGRTEDAHAAIRQARDRVLRIAATLEPDDRASYLTNVDANARTLKLAGEWLGEEAVTT